jgi:hypothetical protein
MALEKINVPVVKNTRSSGLELLKGRVAAFITRT